MTLPRSYVDGFLVHWEAGEYEAEVKSMRQHSEAIRPLIELPTATTGQTGMVAKRAQAVRARLARTARKAPEVMVKIYSSCRGMNQVGRHFDYISRKGLIELEDQDGMILKGRDQLKALKKDWRTGGLEEIPTVSDRRDTLNVVFSMPINTDEVSLKRAVRAFAAQTFVGHDYIFAYHTRATDPDPDPPGHPHVHLSVKTLSLAGKRLNPRKADLQAWREGFAEQLRAHGVEANATSRLARLQRNRGEKRSRIALRERGEGASPEVSKMSDANREARAKTLERARLAYYGRAIEVLLQSEDFGDRRLAFDLSHAFGLRQPDERKPPPSTALF